MKKLLFKLVGFFQKFFKTKVLFFPESRVSHLKGKTAVKSDLGFWYTGNVFDSEDIAYGIAKNGTVEREGTGLVIKILDLLLKQKEKIIFFDVGANTGYYGILAAHFGKGKIRTYAFEPVKEYTEIEKETVLLNKLDDYVNIFNYCLGDCDAETEIYLAGSGTTTRKEFLGHDLAPARKVKVRALDKLIKQEQIPGPDFIKIDVEGAEYSVLKGAKETILKDKPVIWYESSKSIPERKFENSEFIKTQEFLASLGYSVYFCGEQGIIKVGGQKIPLGVWMYLALPLGGGLEQLLYENK